MSDIVTAVIVAVIGSQAFSLIVQAIIEKIRKPSAMAVGMKLLLQDRIRGVVLAALSRGETTEAERKYVADAMEVYHALKGDGEMTHMLQEYNALSVNYFKEAS